MNAPLLLLRSALFTSCMAVMVGEPMAQKLEAETPDFRYQCFVEGLNTEQFALGYPKAVKKLDSFDSKIQTAGLMTLSATGELAAIPFIVPFLDSRDGSVRIYAGLALQRIVSAHTLKRRDLSQPTKVVIKSLDPNDTDLRPLAWVIVGMLGKPDDGNTHAYAATMIGYLNLREFDGQLEQLLKSRHPAVRNAAKNAMEMMGIDNPQRPFTAEELAAARQTAESFGKLFLAQDEDTFASLLLPKSAVGAVFSQEFLKRTSADQLYSKMVKANLTRFKEFRSMLGDTSNLLVSSFELGNPSQSETYAPEIRVMKNSYVVLAYANRVIVKIKVEEMVFVDGNCYIVELD